MAIELKNVTHVYQARVEMNIVALNNIDLTIEDGELLALIGHTGSGKSTLAQHLNGLLKPTSGKVLIDGEDINENRSKYRFEVGLVFQYPEYQLFEETVKKDIAFGPKNMGLTEDEINQRVKSAMELVGLNYEEIGEKSPFELSGGQMRRVALAGVLAMQPRYLVLDEPTAGLDPKGRYYLLNDIKRLHEQGTTIVIISHSMDDVAWLAERIAVMERGRIVKTGSPKDIFSQYSFLSDMGLDVPQASELSYKLIEKGVPIKNCFKLEELADELQNLLKNGGKTGA
ncbi:MAG: energy-coupling factor transporter ATPase [Christensenellales bacterium]|jgi:energy-coupling factor transport system ATP-binding protein|nr:energy-coupling factor transporter ATPase [Christensenellaceae bacterium]